MYAVSDSTYVVRRFTISNLSKGYTVRIESIGSNYEGRKKEQFTRFIEEARYYITV